MMLKKPQSSALVPIGIVLLFSLCLSYVILYAVFFHMTTITPQHFTNAEQSAQHQDIIAYLHGSLFLENPLSFLTPNERDHMTDVKELFDGLFILHLCALGVLLGIIGVFAAQRLWLSLDELLGRSLILGGGIVFAFAFLLAILASFSFMGFWNGMHVLLFPQGNWQFPFESTLITLYPEAFFAKMATGFLSRATLAGLCALVLGVFINKMRNESQRFEKKFIKKRPAGGKK